MTSLRQVGLRVRNASFGEWRDLVTKPGFVEKAAAAVDNPKGPEAQLILKRVLPLVPRMPHK